MACITAHIKQGVRSVGGVLGRRIDLFSPLQHILPAFFFRDIDYVPYLKKIPLFLLIALVIVSFIVTSMPHIFLA